MRAVNKDNHKNIYCAHCDYYTYEEELRQCFCTQTNPRKPIEYWHRCKCFTWAKRYEQAEPKEAE